MDGKGVFGLKFWFMGSVIVVGNKAASRNGDESH